MFAYSTAAEMLALCEREKISVGELALRREIEMSGRSREEIFGKMRALFRTMRESVLRGLEIRNPSPSGLSGGDAAKVLAYAESGDSLLGATLTRLVACSCAVLETNAQFGRIVATPTAGSSGIVPACLVLLEETRGTDEDTLTRALFTASGIGVVIAGNAFLAGAQGGCQAEVGSASCIAAAAVVEALGREVKVGIGSLGHARRGQPTQYLFLIVHVSSFFSIVHRMSGVRRAAWRGRGHTTDSGGFRAAHAADGRRRGRGRYRRRSGADRP